MSDVPFNKQLYENSGLAELFADAPTDSNGFFNAREPNLAILHEKPEHRLLLWMKAQGASNNEIAEQSGYTVPWISQLMRQPWAQARLVEMMTDAGVDVLTQTLKAAVPDCIERLKEMVSDDDLYQTHPSVVRSACVDLIQQYLGKPKQQVDVTQTPTSGASVEDLDKQIEQHDKEINRLQGVI